ncbi:uncharacterized protein LOC143302224 isoform X2 [Babylonia areolata]|uniref:uncharacterized protein LOC143302224 isoform X2 n=1 Tax=Babylonia areolata TaxID=304850 RepID=UPI003FD6B3FA
MDRPFTPHEDRPRSTPEPLTSFHNPDQPDNVAAVQPVNGQVSDSDSIDRDETNDSALGSSTNRRDMFNAGTVNNEAASGVDDREENGRSSSAPARTPNSAEHVPVYAAASMSRPRNTRPPVSILGDVDSEMPSLEPAQPMPGGSRHEHTASSDGAESSEQQDPFLQHYSELSPGPSESKMKCAQCGYSTEEKILFRRHKRQHQRANPTSIFHCTKCQFSTPAPRRMREHYSFQHNEDFGNTFPNTSVLMRSSTFTNPRFNHLAYNSDNGYYTVNLTGRGINSYRLPQQPRSTMQFEPSTPSSTIVSGCGNGGFTQPMGFPTFRAHNDRRPFPINHQSPISELTLEYLFSPNVTASSTITSCEYPARPSNPHRPDLNNFSPLRGSTSSSRDLFARQTPSSPNRNRCSMSMHEGEAVKVKTEPIDCDGVSDVSSSGVPGLFERGERGGGGNEQERPQRSNAPEPTTTQPRYRRPLFESTTSPQRIAIEQSDEIATSAGDVSRVSQSSEAASSHMDARSGSVEDSEQEERRESGGGDGDNSLGHHLLFNIKAETSSVAVQCSGSSAMKSETLPLVTVAAAEHSTESRPHHRTIERGVQCEILSPPQRRITSRTLSTDSEQQSVSGSDTRCMHCGIMFEDEVIFSIHLGCHSHTDPFVCNVCGKKCHNKYGFYSHIMRGHHL